MEKSRTFVSAPIIEKAHQMDIKPTVHQEALQFFAENKGQINSIFYDQLFRYDGKGNELSHSEVLEQTYIPGPYSLGKKLKHFEITQQEYDKLMEMGGKLFIGRSWLELK